VKGSLRPEGRGLAVRMEDRYDTGIDDLWDAVTDPDRLARWIGTVTGDLRPGGTIAVSLTSKYEAPGRVDVCERPHRLLVTFDPGTDEETVVEAVLTEDGAGTRLTVEERSFPAERAPDHGAGWQAHLEDLAAHLAGRDPVDWVTRWTELIPAYRALA
jgi:uncharacterized protein YndB with AHSA1/START domain